MALHISQQIFGSDPDVLQADEIVGHSYLFLKEQLQLSIMPPPHSGILHGTMIGVYCVVYHPYAPPSLFTFIVGWYRTYIYK
jgi:hypothetical protein